MKTTIEIPDPLFDRLRRRAARDRTTMRALIEAALRRYLGNSQSSGASFKLKDGSFTGQGLAPGVNGADWAQIRGMIYEGRGG